MVNIGLVGLPNSGKSALFNALTGSRQRVANFPGITVDRKVGYRKITQSHSKDELKDELKIVDLPGIYTLDANSLDERVTRDYILDTESDHAPDVLIIVVDATSIKKSLFLIEQIRELGLPFVVALNMMDQSVQRGQKLDIEAFSSLLGGINIIPTVATEDEGLDQLEEAIIKVLKFEKNPISIPANFIQKVKASDYVKEKLDQVNFIFNKVVKNKIQKDNFTEKIDSLVLHPVLGFAIMLTTFLGLFQLLFVGADPFVGWIEYGFELLAHTIDLLLADGDFKSLLIDGIIAGVGGVVVFLPHIIFLFIIIHFLEDFGYLGRAAFLLDYIMRKLGLPGKAVIPLLSSHACAIPGIMSARIIEDRKQRLITQLIAPLMACSARLPVYTLLIAAIVPNKTVMGFLGLPGLIMFALYVFAIFVSFFVAFVFRKVMSGASVSYLMMELPPYRMPRLINVLRGAWQKGVLFLKKAGTIIFVLSILIWILVSFPKAPQGSEGLKIEYSAAAFIGKTFEPVFRPLGFDWKMTTALIPSFAAREVLVSAMATVMAMEKEAEDPKEKDEDQDQDEDQLVEKLSVIMKQKYSVASLLALLVWFIFSPQCIATFGVLKKETGSYKIPILYGAYTLILAYFFSLMTYLAASSVSA